MEPTTDPTKTPTEDPTEPTSNPTAVLACPSQSATSTVDDFTVTIDIDCAAETVNVVIEYAAYSDNWFGVVFSTSMIGDALVYTTGISGDTVSEGLWPYELTAKSSSGVDRDTSSTWTENSITESGSTITVDYTANLADTPIFSTSTESVTWRGMADSSGLALTYHG